MTVLNNPLLRYDNYVNIPAVIPTWEISLFKQTIDF